MRKYLLGDTVQPITVSDEGFAHQAAGSSLVIAKFTMIKSGQCSQQNLRSTVGTCSEGIAHEHRSFGTLTLLGEVTGGDGPGGAAG